MTRPPQLSDVIPPHEPNNHAKVESLIRAYENNFDVSPVVVLTWREWPPTAITGSHRLAALSEVYNEDVELDDLDGYVVPVDGEGIHAALTAMALDDDADGRDWAASALAWLDIARSDQGADFNTLCEALSETGVLEPDAHDALQGQW